MNSDREDVELVASRIRQRRERLGFTQAGLAEMAGIDGGYYAVSHWEGGRRSPDIWNLRSLALALDCSTDYLLGLKDEP